MIAQLQPLKLLWKPFAVDLSFSWCIRISNMQDTLSPFRPPPSLHPKSNFSMLYYGFVVVGTAVLVLAAYNLIVIKCCTRRPETEPPYGPRRRPNRLLRLNSSRSFESSSIDMVASRYKYRKREGVNQGSDYECAVCLSIFEEGEEVRKLPKCNHSFHVACIDMWLYSHSDCPLCRAPVEVPVLRQHMSDSDMSV